MPELLWLAQLGLVVYWVHDSTPGQQRTRTLIETAVPYLESLVGLSRMKVFRADDGARPGAGQAPPTGVTSGAGVDAVSTRGAHGAADRGRTKACDTYIRRRADPTDRCRRPPDPAPGTGTGIRAACAANPTSGAVTDGDCLIGQRPGARRHRRCRRARSLPVQRKVTSTQALSVEVEAVPEGAVGDVDAGRVVHPRPNSSRPPL